MIVKELYKSFGKFPVLKGVDLELKKGAITAVLGPNGSGKTTLIKCILGMVIKQSGEIFIDHEKINQGCLYRRDIGYLPQIARFPENLKVKELVNMIRDIRNQPADPGKLIEIFGLEPFMNTTLKNLSGGTRQKVNVLLAFMFDTAYYILDEPTVGLDPLAMMKFRQLLLQEKAKGKTILLTTHMVHLVEELADEVVFLLEGQVYFQGDIRSLKEKQQAASLEEAIAKILKIHQDD